MCLQTMQEKPLVATKDMKVYKLLNYVSPTKASAVYQSHNYILGKLYKTNIKETIEMVSFDNNAVDTCKVVNEKGGNTIYSFAEGFHSAFHMKRFLNTRMNKGISIYECTIPKGSLYYIGFTALLVSNQIIINKLKRQI